MTEARTYRRAPRTTALYARAAAAAVPGASRLPFLPGGGGEIPALRRIQLGVRARAGQLGDYCTLCGFDPGSRYLPASYPHVLAFPLQMAILTDGSFPHPPVGLVHIENRIVQRRAIPRGEALELEVHAERAAPHPRGVSFQLVSRARISGETVWEETSTMLRRRPAEGAEERPAAKEESPTAPAQAEPPVIAGGGERETAFWRLPSDLGRLYGAISGDRNPIHMHPLPARALGFPGAIAHGMWTFARALATLAGELADGHAIEASFQRPIVLPASVQLSSRDADGEREFAVRDVARQTSHMRGRIWATPGDWPRPTTTTTRKQEA